MRQAVIDWASVLDTVRRLGWSKGLIARDLLISPYVLDGMPHGQADPWYSAGEALLLVADEQAPWCPVIDWRRVMLDIYDFGLSRYKVSGMVGISSEQVDRVECGREPRHGPGLKILQLHAFITSWRGFDAA